MRPIVISDLQVPTDLKEAIHHAPLEAVTDLWSAFEEDFEASGQRWLCRNDRFYLLVRILNRIDLMHPWLYERCREVEASPDGHLDLWAREHYKDLANDTPMLTANRGWTTHGDLRVGDSVFAPSGQPTQVVAVTETFTDSECYRLTFNDGAQIVAGAGHQWQIRRKVRRRVANGLRAVEFVNETVSTCDMADMDRVDVGTALPLVFPPKQLPLHPYLLGAWLGDGHSAAGRLTGVDEEIFERIERLGYSLSKPTHMSRTVYGIAPTLRDLGVLNAKSIPSAYMTGSVNQRMELLRGLMDTDGHCNTRGTATFCNTNDALASQVFELATGLGLKPRMRSYSFRSNAEKAVDGRYHYKQVSFQAHDDRNPFHLSRKAKRAISPSCYRGARTLTKIEKVDSVPTRCIQVEGGLYVAGRDLVPTRNSTIITYAGAIQRTLVDPEITIGIFSHTKPIAKAFLRQIQKEFESNEALRGLFPEIFYINPAKDSPVWSLDAGITVKRKTNPREATVEAHGLVDGMPTSKHFQLLIYDDVVVPSSVSTPEQIAKTTEAWELSDNLGAVGGQKWMIGTRYHYGDTYEEVMKRGAAAQRIHPATDDGTIDGTPVLFTQELWDEKVKTQGESTIACQMLQNPLAGKQREFNIEHVGVYETRPTILNIYIMVDPARSNKKGSANTAMVALGLDYAMNKYLLDGYDTKMDLLARWQYMLGLYEKWKREPGVQSIYVGYERYGAIADLQYFEEQMRLTGKRFDIVELEWPRDGDGSKRDRIQRLGPDIRNHKIFTPYETDPKNLTANQRKVKEQGYSFRIAQPIRRRDENGRIYDLSQRLRNQIHFFPFGGRVDVLDATSRIYDMEPMAPRYSEARYAEPDFV
jgi:hypothetical protein